MGTPSERRRIGDGSPDVCSSDPPSPDPEVGDEPPPPGATPGIAEVVPLYRPEVAAFVASVPVAHHLASATLGTFHERRGEQALLRGGGGALPATWGRVFAENSEIKWDGDVAPSRSEEHTSELQSLMRISYAVFCLKKKKHNKKKI